MNRLLIRCARLALLVPLLAACSLGGASTAAPSVPPSPTARPVAIQAGVSIPGRLLFVQDGNLYLHEGSNTRQVTTDGITRDPAWAPDGSRVAFVRREQSYSDVYVLNTGGGLPTQITFNRGESEPWTQEFMHQVVWAFAPTWSPDSDELVFVSQAAPPASDPPTEQPLALYRYALDTVGSRQLSGDDLLVRSEGADMQRPDWARDGSLLAYVQVPRGSGAKQIMVYDPANGTTQPYPGIPENAYDPAWSPDSRWLAFAAQIDGRTDIWAIPHPAIGGSAVRLTDSGIARAPEWSPDGTQLAFVQVGDRGTNLFVMKLDPAGGSLAGAAPTALTTNGQLDANSGLSWGN